MQTSSTNDVKTELKHGNPKASEERDSVSGTGILNRSQTDFRNSVDSQQENVKASMERSSVSSEIGGHTRQQNSGKSGVEVGQVEKKITKKGPHQDLEMIKEEQNEKVAKPVAKAALCSIDTPAIILLQFGLIGVKTINLIFILTELVGIGNIEWATVDTPQQQHFCLLSQGLVRCDEPYASCPGSPNATAGVDNARVDNANCYICHRVSVAVIIFMIGAFIFSSVSLGLILPAWFSEDLKLQPYHLAFASDFFHFGSSLMAWALWHICFEAIKRDGNTKDVTLSAGYTLMLTSFILAILFSIVDIFLAEIFPKALNAYHNGRYYEEYPSWSIAIFGRSRRNNEEKRNNEGKTKEAVEGRHFHRGRQTGSFGSFFNFGNPIITGTPTGSRPMLPRPIKNIVERKEDAETNQNADSPRNDDEALANADAVLKLALAKKLAKTGAGIYIGENKGGYSKWYEIHSKNSSRIIELLSKDQKPQSEKSISQEYAGPLKKWRIWYKRLQREKNNPDGPIHLEHFLRHFMLTLYRLKFDVDQYMKGFTNGRHVLSRNIKPHISSLEKSLEFMAKALENEDLEAVKKVVANIEHDEVNIDGKNRKDTLKTARINGDSDDDEIFEDIEKGSMIGPTKISFSKGQRMVSKITAKKYVYLHTMDRTGKRAMIVIQEEGTPNMFAGKICQGGLEVHKETNQASTLRERLQRQNLPLERPKNIMVVEDFLYESGCVITVTAYARFGDLSTYRQSVIRPLEDRIHGSPKKFAKCNRFIMQQIFSALEHLHAHEIYHLDMKLKNILMFNLNEVDMKKLEPEDLKELLEIPLAKPMISDFGIASFEKNRIMGSGTVTFAPPEQLNWGGNKVEKNPEVNCEKIDVYSTGMVWFYLHIPSIPVGKGDVKWVDMVPDSDRSMLERCINAADPTKRPVAKDVRIFFQKSKLIIKDPATNDVPEMKSAHEGSRDSSVEDTGN
mmetsp:Transcript_6541/g.15874  ORF Transcript_6541/g.15874 Transcript_6541/m.15874 type:complete len:961 (-) Transcript_6541:116-2998(-)